MSGQTGKEHDREHERRKDHRLIGTGVVEIQLGASRESELTASQPLSAIASACSGPIPGCGRDSLHPWPRRSDDDGRSLRHPVRCRGISSSRDTPHVERSTPRRERPVTETEVDPRGCPRAGSTRAAMVPTTRRSTTREWVSCAHGRGSARGGERRGNPMSTPRNSGCPTLGTSHGQRMKSAEPGSRTDAVKLRLSPRSWVARLRIRRIPPCTIRCRRVARPSPSWR